MPEVDDERQATEGERKRDPDPPAHVFFHREPREERDEQRTEVLDQKRDADLETVDRKEVEELDEGDAEDPEGGEVEELPPVRAQAPRPRCEQDQGEADQRACAAHLGQPQRGQPRLEDHLRDGPVECEQRPGSECHRIADRRPALSRHSLGGDEGDVRHGSGTLSAYTDGERGVAQPGRALPLGGRSRQFESARPDCGPRDPRRRRGARARLPRDRAADPAGGSRPDDRRVLASRLPGAAFRTCVCSRLPTAASTAARIPGGSSRTGTPPRRSSASFGGSTRRGSRSGGCGSSTRYGGDDFRSIEADNTSAFNCRAATGSSRWSQHAYGRAIDVNPIENPYVSGGASSHPASRPYLDRSRHQPGTAYAGGVLVEAFRAAGWGWGGSWSGGVQDYQHFSASGR